MPPKCQSFGLFLATSLVAAFCGLASGGQAETHPALRAAADELARIYREATGAEPPPARFAVDPSLDALHDEYRIVSEGDSAAFVGANPRAVLYAVYDFLARRAGCRWYWDGDVVPKTDKIDFSGLDVREKSRFEYRAIRYFAHRGLTRFQAEHWGLEDWKREIDWCVKRRLNTVMMRLGDEDAFQKAFPDIVPYPDPREPSKMEGYDNRALFWPLEYRGQLRRAVREYASSRGLMVPEDFGTMTHWYSRTPEAFLRKMKPDFLPQEAGNYREDSGRVWDVRQDKWLDAYFRLTEAQVADGAKPDLLHTIGLGERRAFTNRAENLKLKIDVIHRLVAGARRRWPEAKVLLAGWDFFGTWHSSEVRRLFETLDPSSVLLWDYEGDSPLKRFGNVTEWGVVGRFPYTFGLFVNSAAGCDIRLDYPFVERRGAKLAEDPFCRGFILWPEASHIDTFMLDWFVENAWRPFRDRKALLHAFCCGRYGASAVAMERIWSGLMALPLASYECWGGNLANREPYDVVSFTSEINEPNAPGWAIARELPRFAAAPRLLRALAAVVGDAPMLRRDAVDIARTLADRLVLRARAELVVSYRRWRATGEGISRVEELAAAFESIGVHFADLLEQHTDYSLHESLLRLNAVARIANPAFEHVLVDNATCHYCRSHQYEAARYWYAPCMRDLARAVRAKTAADDGTPLPIDALAANGYRERMLARSLSEMAPVRKRTARNLRETLRALAADADAILSSPPVGVARRPPAWFVRATLVDSPVDPSAVASQAASGAGVLCIGEAEADGVRAFTAAAHDRGLHVMQSVPVPVAATAAEVEVFAGELCRRVRDGGVDGFFLVGSDRLALDAWAHVRERLEDVLPDVVLVSDDRRYDGLLRVFDGLCDASSDSVVDGVLNRSIPVGALKRRHADDRAHFPAATRFVRRAVEPPSSPRGRAGAFLRFMLEGVPRFRSADFMLFAEMARLRNEDPFYNDVPLAWRGNDHPESVVSFVRRDANCGSLLAVLNVGAEAVRVKVEDVEAFAVVPSASSGFSADGDVFVLEPYGFVAGDVRDPF